MIALHFDTRRFWPALCAFTLVGWIAAGAQATPDTIPVQGYLTDEQGVPFDGEVSATLSLYTTWDAAEPVFTEDHALLVDNGHFTVYLGSEDGLELLLFSEADELFLGVKVGNDNEMQPRLPMGASPFAMAAVYAEDSETVGGMPPSAFAQNEHSHPFSQLDDVPADLLDGDDDTTYTVSAPLQMEGNEIRFSHPCELGEVFKWTGAGWACAADETGSNLTGQSPVVIDGTVVGLTQACAVNQILKWNGSQWLCQADQAFLPSVGTGLSLSGDVLQVDANIDDGSRYDARFAPFSHTHDFSSLENIPGDVLDGDADTTYTVALPLTMTDTKIGLTVSCAAGEMLKWDGQAWVCGVDDRGLTQAGFGLTASDGDVAVDAEVMQRRVEGMCPDGEAMQGVHADGSVSCAPVETAVYRAPLDQDGGVVGLRTDCATGEVLQYNGASWECQTVGSNGIVVGQGLVTDSGVLQVSADIDDGSRYDGRFLNQKNAGGYAVSTNLSFAVDAPDSWTQGACGTDLTEGIVLPFNLDVFGVTTNQITVSNAGVIIFGRTDATISNVNTSLPTSAVSDPALFMFWDDGLTCRQMAYTVSGEPPHRTFMLLQDSLGVDHFVLYRVVIREDTGSIQVLYTCDSTAKSQGASATIGLQGPGGANAEAIPISVNTESLDCNETGYQHVTFYHP